MVFYLNRSTSVYRNSFNCESSSLPLADFGRTYAIWLLYNISDSRSKPNPGQGHYINTRHQTRGDSPYVTSNASIVQTKTFRSLDDGMCDLATRCQHTDVA